MCHLISSYYNLNFHGVSVSAYDLVFQIRQLITVFCYMYEWSKLQPQPGWTPDSAHAGSLLIIRSVDISNMWMTNDIERHKEELGTSWKALLVFIDSRS